MNLQHPGCHGNRRGSILILLAVLIPVLGILAAFTINSAYMQLSNTELMVATDAAARAGGRALSEHQDIDEAKTAAQATAALNTVAGSPLRLRTSGNKSDVQFGLSSPKAGDGSGFQFTRVPDPAIAAGVPTNAIRIFGRRNQGSLGGPVEMIFQGFLSSTQFKPAKSAVAMQVDRDIVLVLDRSGSMAWTEYDWPSGTSPYYISTLDAGVRARLLIKRRNNYYYNTGVDPYDYLNWVWEEYYDLGPAPLSPWQNLILAVEGFLEVLEETPQTEHVALASYATDASLDLDLTSDYDAVLAALDNLGPGGETAIGLGMQAGIEGLLKEEFTRRYAAKTMVVMTDGMHNRDIDPVDVAHSIADTSNVTIHSVTFTDGGDQARMKEVASVGGGLHYHAENGDVLIETFREIANNLPTIITQ